MSAPINAAGKTNARLVLDIIDEAIAVLQTNAPRREIAQRLRHSRDVLRHWSRLLRKTYPETTKRGL